MLHHSFTTLFTLGLVALASGRTLSRREEAFEGKERNHDAIVPFAQQVADGLPGQLELQFKPALSDVQGCLPYAAVDAEGFHSGGLKPTEDGGDCRDPSKGQVYSRVGTSNGRTAVLYGWYLPKLVTNVVSRHWYLSTVVWLHTEKCNATAADFTVAGVSYSRGPGEYNANFEGRPTLFATDAVSNTHPVVRYEGKGLVFPSDQNVKDGLDTPLISWNKLPQPAIDQFNGFVYYRAQCPFQDANFQASLDAAFRPEFYANLKAEPDAAACAATSAANTPPAIKAARALRIADTEPVVDDTDGDGKHPPPDPVFTPTPPRSSSSSRSGSSTRSSTSSTSGTSTQSSTATPTSSEPTASSKPTQATPTPTEPAATAKPTPSQAAPPPKATPTQAAPPPKPTQPTQPEPAPTQPAPPPKPTQPAPAPAPAPAPTRQAAPPPQQQPPVKAKKPGRTKGRKGFFRVRDSEDEESGLDEEEPVVDDEEPGLDDPAFALADGPADPAFTPTPTNPAIAWRG
ncbi:necrosis inducing protein-domain-containing protein [Colletotrichum cereale]|nr:necrosis inducing protein-domain-containing protein [Colletotrichum cereale]